MWFLVQNLSYNIQIFNSFIRVQFVFVSCSGVVPRTIAHIGTCSDVRIRIFNEEHSMFCFVVLFLRNDSHITFPTIPTNCFNSKLTTPE